MIKEFVVKRSKWARGGENGPSKLLNDSGNMCCLGFLGAACGLDPQDLVNKTYPKHCSEHDKYPVLYNKNWGHFAIVNDDSYISEDDRESILTEMFNSIGIKISFED